MPCWRRLSAARVPPALAAETLKIASPIRGSWEGAIPELGKQAGIFQKHGLDLDILYTQGGGETLQVVVSGAVDVGLSAGVLGSLGAYGKGAPIRIIGASSTGSGETFWWVAARLAVAFDPRGQRPDHRLFHQRRLLPYRGAAFHQRIRPQGASRSPTGDSAGTITQVMSGQVDVGWAVAPFVLDLLDKGEARMIARASDIAAVRGQTIRVQITNAQNLAAKKDAFARYMKAYNETVAWMYSSPEAVPRYIAFSGLSEPAVRLMLKDFIPKESLQTATISGLDESMKDAVQFKFLPAPLNEGQLKELIQIVPAARNCGRAAGGIARKSRKNMMRSNSKQIGDIAVTALSDGVLATPLDVVLGIEQAEAERLAGKQAGEPVAIAVNAFLLERRGHDARWSMPAPATRMGPTLGKLADSLRAVGVAPERIDDHPAHPPPFRPFQRAGRR